MSGISSLPIVSAAPDQLREGINASVIGSSIPLPHPVAAIEHQWARQQDVNQKALLSRLYGSHMPMKLHMEQVS
jgi:hypothetical protein